MARSGSLPLRIRVLALLLLYPSTGRHAYAISKELGVSSGSLYPALGRLLGAGHIETREGPVLRRGTTEKPQVLYLITEPGLAHLRSMREELTPMPARAPRRVRVPKLLPVGGPMLPKEG